MNERERWLDWLASIGYGIDWRTDADPPCGLNELADAYVRGTGEEDRRTWMWCIEEETGTWRGSTAPTTASVIERGEG